MALNGFLGHYPEIRREIYSVAPLETLCKLSSTCKDLDREIREFFTKKFLLSSSTLPSFYDPLVKMMPNYWQLFALWFPDRPKTHLTCNLWVLAEKVAEVFKGGKKWNTYLLPYLRHGQALDIAVYHQLAGDPDLIEKLSFHVAFQIVETLDNRKTLINDRSTLISIHQQLIQSEIHPQLSETEVLCKRNEIKFLTCFLSLNTSDLLHFYCRIFTRKTKNEIEEYFPEFSQELKEAVVSILASVEGGINTELITPIEDVQFLNDFVQEECETSTSESEDSTDE